MKISFVKPITVLLLIFLQFAVYSQESTNTAGGNANGSGGSVSYSVGQVVYTTNTGANGSVSQGVQQPYEISVITAIEEAKGINLSVSAYPNPTTDFLTLEVNNIELSNLSFQIFDLQGKLIQNQKIIDKQTSIVMSNLSPATYFVKVFQANTEIKTFKIIKTQ